MGLPRRLVLATALALAAPAAQAFSISFDWSGLTLCTNGRPNTVDNPAFRIRDLPAGTQSVVFRLTDLDVPSYDHGGGTVNMSQQSGTLPRGAFRYKSPCPPSGAHTYEWTATAKSGRNGRGQTLGIAKAQRRYP